jgi:hypothetical protein
VPHLEGLAAVGKLQSFRVEDCPVPGRKKIVAVSNDGNLYETKCLDERSVKHVVLFLNISKNLSRLQVQSGNTEKGEAEP